MKIREATLEVTGKDSDWHEIGTVTIVFSNGRVASFDDVRRDKFETWVATGYDPRHIPYDMAFAFGRLWRSVEGEEAEEAEEGEEEGEGQIREDDPLGQATGFPSPDFEPEGEEE